MSRASLSFYVGASETCIFICWTCIASVLIDKPEHLISLFLIPLILVACFLIMYAADRLRDSCKSAGAGLAVIAAGMWLLISKDGGSGFIFIFPLLGLLFVHRLTIIPRAYRLEEAMKSFFFIDTFVLPIFTFICAGVAPKALMVPLQSIVFAVFMYIILRVFSFLMIQHSYSKKRLTHFQGIVPLLVVVFFAVFMLFLTAYRYAVLLLLNLTRPLESLFNRISPVKQDGVAMPTMPGGPSQKKLEQITPHFPWWLWLLVVPTIAIIIWLLFRKPILNDSAEAEEINNDVTITRAKLNKEMPLELVATASFVRQIYQKMLRFFDKKGKPIQLFETPREYAVRLSSHVNQQETVQELTRLSTIYEQVRYGEMNEEESIQLKEQASQTWTKIQSLESK